MPIQPVEKVWMNGGLLDWKDAKVHVLTHALHYGTAVFEGVRCYETPRGPAIFRLNDHLERMERSAKIFLMEVPYTVAELTDACVGLVSVNGLQSCYLRPLAFRGCGEMGVNPQHNPVDVVIAAWRWGAYLGKEGLERGIRATVSSWRRQDPNIIPPQAKVTGAYVNSAVAKQEAVRAGFDEAIMLNPHGFVSEATGENVFVVKGGEVFTPPESAGPLSGVTRDTIMTLARDLGTPVTERDITRADLYTAQEIFFTGTAAEVTPVREIDGRPIDAPGPVTQALQQKYFSVVEGRDEKYFDWLTFVKS
ncbi:MAG TPA: branched-chain amino acid transaminase [Actinomycetota bacterium]|jgi:branched-chain amino acid aminotransferase|nr:branched-chain amino acid transaminase [Actinomycetota bacterium]